MNLNLSKEEIEYIKDKFGFEELPKELEGVVSFYNQIIDAWIDTDPFTNEDVKLFNILSKISEIIEEIAYFDEEMGEWKVKKEYKK